MYTRGVVAATIAALASCTAATPGDFGNNYLWGADSLGHLVKRQATATPTPSPVADSGCKNSARNRACWGNGYSIATDFDLKHPTTGVTRYYTFDITNTTCSPDGNGQQQCLLVNNSYPGPVLTADWGDFLSITVNNRMQDNGTSLHWHGVRQLNSVGADGVNGITECPIAPGDSFTYEFQATQFGSSWYHSHFSAQYGVGTMGPIVINGPTTSNYDIDLGSFFVNDWYYADAWQVNLQTLANLQQGQPPPPSDNILINGTAKNANGGGALAQVTLTPGMKHKLRLVNPSVDNFIRVSLDNHPFTIVAADFIPTQPMSGYDWILFGPGQRYEVIIEANATAGNYLFRAEVASDCLSAGNKAGRALFTYAGTPVAEPVDTAGAAPANGCAEIQTVPYWNQTVDQSTFDDQVKTLTTDLTQVPSYTGNGQNIVVWSLNFTSLNVDWVYPTLSYVNDGNTSYPASLDLIEIPNEGTWTYWIIQTLQTTAGPTAIAAPPPPHPIHLHGHDYFVLGQGTGAFDRATANLDFVRPPRRDTATLPSVGWLALAFPANNPGAWLMHCHIAWHVGEGLGVQFLESKNQINMPDMDVFNKQCSNWKNFQAGMPYPKQDSGL